MTLIKTGRSAKMILISMALACSPGQRNPRRRHDTFAAKLSQIWYLSIHCLQGNPVYVTTSVSAEHMAKVMLSKTEEKGISQSNRRQPFSCGIMGRCKEIPESKTSQCLERGFIGRFPASNYQPWRYNRENNSLR